jgi:hypothetical protein
MGLVGGEVEGAVASEVKNVECGGGEDEETGERSAAQARSERSRIALAIFHEYPTFICRARWRHVVAGEGL